MVSKQTPRSRIPRVNLAAHRNTARFLTAGFFVLALLIFLALAFAQNELSSAGRLQEIVVRQGHLRDVLFTVQQAESGQRGYLLTGNGVYLKPYDLALTRLGPELAKLDAPSIDRPSAADLAQLHAITAQKMSELAKTIALYDAGDRSGALALVHTNLGANSMLQLNDLITRLQGEQMSARLAMQDRTGRESLEMLATTLLGVIGTLLLAWFAIRDSHDQTRLLLAIDTERERIFRLSSDLLATIDFDGTFTSLSPAWERITGMPVREALGRHFAEFLHPEDFAATSSAFEDFKKTGTLGSFENRYRRADGSYCWLSWGGTPLIEESRIYTIARDVTEERLRDEQLRQSQKMEVIGQLTGGIAHDFNNLLTIVLGSLELLQRGLGEADAKIARRLDAAVDGAKRAAALTHRLLAFARRQPLQPNAIDLNRAVTGTAELLNRVLDETIELEYVTAPGLWRVMIDAHQLENSILNLALNARDAMPSGGRLTIETQNSYLDEAYVAGEAGAEIEPGQYAMIAISDTGTGMPPEVKAKVFEPFFTTKPVGRGTGLGLAQVYGFIKQSHGHIKVYSEPGQGTTVKLYLPRLREGAAEEPRVIADQKAADLMGAGETILVVEDEEKVREFAVEMLKDYGYQVIGVENAEPALAIIDSNRHIDLMFTDVVLTGTMNGRQLAEVVSTRRPELPVLFTTGYSRNAIIHHGRLDEGIIFIGKPFTAQELAKMVRRILEGAKVKTED